MQLIYVLNLHVHVDDYIYRIVMCCRSSEPNTPSDTPPNKVSRLESKNNANGLTPTKR